MVMNDLSTVAATLRAEGYEARNLAQVGVTVWRDGEGFFLSAEDLRQLPATATARDIGRMLDARSRLEAHAVNGGSNHR